MQGYALKMRDSLWSGLRTIYNKVSNGKSDISTSQVEYVVKNVIGETDQMELDYIFKNLFRLDPDGSGGVDFNEFANFFLKRHCGEIALQRAHKKNLIGKGSERKLNLKEFLVLLSDAFSFLNIEVDEKNASEIFRQFDTDNDNHITYVEYFSFIDKFICKSPAVIKAEKENRPLPVVDIKPAVVVPQGRIYRSRIRLFLWETLRILYNNFDYNGNGQLEISEIIALVREILKLSSQKDIDYILFDLFNLGNRGYINFTEFCPYFVEHVGNLGLSLLVSRNPSARRLLNRDQFIQLFRSSFAFLNVSRIQDELLWGFFAVIDTDRDGYITFEQYILWLKDFLSPASYRGDIYYFELDDADLSIGSRLITAEIIVPAPTITIAPIRHHDLLVIRRQWATILRTHQLSHYKFSNLELAKRIRATIITLISTFDNNRNRELEENEIVDLLVTLLNENENEIRYVIRNVFRYDRNNDDKVTFEEMADFLMEVHCGEMAIQRLHLRNVYRQGARRVMDVQEFIVTLTDALKFLRATASDTELRQLFSEIDLDRDGLISYREYFEFLKLYFGSGSLASFDQFSITRPVAIPSISFEDEFSQWLIIQSGKVLRGRLEVGRQRFGSNALALILRQVYGEFDLEITFVLERIYGILFDGNSLYSDDEITRLLLILHIGLVLLLRGHNGRKFARWSDRLISQREFLDLILEATRWATLPFNTDTLIKIFLKLDTNRDGYISYLEYFQFLLLILNIPYNSALLNFFNNGLFALPSNENKGDDQQAKEFYGRIWNELRELFNHYLKGGSKTLARAEVKLLINDVLKEQTQSEQDYVFWNYFRLDKDGNEAVEFEEFAPFILNHSTELALQRFHALQRKGKNTLSVDEFVKLATMAFGFLRSIPKEEPTLRVIYRILDTDRSGVLDYKEYLMWAKGLAQKYREL